MTTQGNWPPDPSSRPPTPMLNLVDQTAGKTELLGQFLDWIGLSPDLEIARHHNHVDECRGLDGALACGFRQGELEELSASEREVLPGRYYRLDYDKAEEERQKLSIWMGRIPTGAPR